jgi:hypothetical protein
MLLQRESRLRLWDADYGTKIRQESGSVVQATLYVAFEPSVGVIFVQGYRRTTATRPRATAAQPAIIARLQLGAAA